MFYYYVTFNRRPKIRRSNFLAFHSQVWRCNYLRKDSIAKYKESSDTSEVTVLDEYWEIGPASDVKATFVTPKQDGLYLLIYRRFFPVVGS